jgi:hypothetical protein
VIVLELWREVTCERKLKTRVEASGGGMLLDGADEDEPPAVVDDLGRTGVCNELLGAG